MNLKDILLVQNSLSLNFDNMPSNVFEGTCFGQLFSETYRACKLHVWSWVYALRSNDDIFLGNVDVNII